MRRCYQRCILYHLLFHYPDHHFLQYFPSKAQFPHEVQLFAEEAIKYIVSNDLSTLYQTTLDRNVILYPTAKTFQPLTKYSTPSQVLLLKRIRDYEAYQEMLNHLSFQNSTDFFLDEENRYLRTPKVDNCMKDAF